MDNLAAPAGKYIWRRKDFDAAKHAVCVFALPGQLTVGVRYEIFDTCDTTIDVRNDRGDFLSLPMTHFQPAPAETAALPHAPGQNAQTMPDDIVLQLTAAQLEALKEQWAISLAGASRSETHYDKDTAHKVATSIMDRVLSALQNYGYKDPLALMGVPSAVTKPSTAHWPEWKKALVREPLGEITVTHESLAEDNLVGVVIGNMNGKLSFNVAAIDADIPPGTRLYAAPDVMGSLKRD